MYVPFPCFPLTVEGLTSYYSQSTHISYIIAAANLHAFNYGLKGESDPAVFKRIADSVIVPEFTPKSGVKVQINDSDPVAQDDGQSIYLARRRRMLHFIVSRWCF